MNQQGVVNEQGDPTMTVRVRGGNGEVIELACTVDTGFSGAVLMGERDIHRLDLRFRNQGIFTLADGSDRVVDRYSGDVEWFGKWRTYNVLCLEGGPLLGMILLRGRRLEMDAVEGGQVVVRPISTAAQTA